MNWKATLSTFKINGAEIEIMVEITIGIAPTHHTNYIAVKSTQKSVRANKRTE